MELLVTVAGLLVALYAVIPRERQMELRFRIGLIEWSAAVAGFISILYLEYYALFVAHGWAPDSAKWPHGFTPTSVKPLFILCLALFLGFRVRFARPAQDWEVCQALPGAEQVGVIPRAPCPFRKEQQGVLSHLPRRLQIACTASAPRVAGDADI